MKRFVIKLYIYLTNTPYNLLNFLLDVLIHSKNQKMMALILHHVINLTFQLLLMYEVNLDSIQPKILLIDLDL